MESYAPLLEKTRIPQPALQKLAVISIFSKLRSSPNHLNSESEPGKRAISQCLTSSSPNVVDESVRQLCRLVTDGVVSVTNGLLELQSAVEGSDPKFVPVYVKGLGFLVRFGFQKNNGGWKFASVLTHPFVMVNFISIYLFRISHFKFMHINNAYTQLLTFWIKFEVKSYKF